MNNRIQSQKVMKINQDQLKIIQTDVITYHNLQPQLKKLVFSITRNRTQSNIISKNQIMFGNSIQSRIRLESIKTPQMENLNKITEKYQNKSLSTSRSSQFFHKQQLNQSLARHIHHGNYFFDKIKENMQGDLEASLQKKMSQDALNQIHMIATYQEFMPEVTLLHKGKFLMKYQIALDLDETLVHTESIQRNRAYDFKNEEFGVFIRPYCQHLLSELSKVADLFVFTSANQKYAKTIVQLLDPDNIFFKGVYFRNHCVTLQSRIQVKHLGILSVDFSKIILVDNSPIFYMAQPYNGIPIAPFIDDKQDNELLKLLSFLKEKILCLDDVRMTIKRHFQYEMFRQFSDGVQAFNILFE